MKKKNLNSLKLNKKSISKFESLCGGVQNETVAEKATEGGIFTLVYSAIWCPPPVMTEDGSTCA